jgi:heat-inducible transcriptional repressor
LGLEGNEKAMPGDPLNNERTQEILRRAISTFVSTGRPVGSRMIARHSRENLSSATIRNIMADLEEMGYLRQPHASAGRIPTDKAYRFYVDSLLERHELSPKERSLVDSGLRPDDSPEHLMVRTSQILSQVSRSVGIVVSPPISHVALQHIQFVKLADKRVLVVLVSRAGIVQNRILHVQEEFNQTELDEAARYIVDHFQNKTLLDVKEEIVRLIQQERAAQDRLMRRVIVLGTKTFSEGVEDIPSEVYLDGASNLMKIPEFSDINRMRALFEAIEHKSKLALLISQCIQSDTQEVHITIGAENTIPGIEDCTLITSRYVVDEKTHGSLGILGPTRMEYGKAISLVEYVAGFFGRVLGARN